VNALSPPPQASRMPVLFIGHGNPMNAIRDMPFTRSLPNLGNALPRPKAVLCIPTPDHRYPLLYALGASDEADPLRFEYEGIEFEKPRLTSGEAPLGAQSEA
jgi:aromatic ring-opening dioxygenase catalytic subunit (LigB family)